MHLTVVVLAFNVAVEEKNEKLIENSRWLTLVYFTAIKYKLIWKNWIEKIKTFQSFIE